MSVDVVNVHNSLSSSSRLSSALGSTDPAQECDQEQLEPVGINGVLSKDLAAQGLSNLNWSADGTCQVFLNLTLPNCQLRDISLLQSYVHLQLLELPHNDIEDLSPLDGMSALLELDVSHNRISRLLDFKPPKNLKIVKMSFNLIGEIPDLSAHHYLQHLDLGYNNIEVISGLANCRRLQYLNLQHNKIGEIQGLDNLPLQFLNLSCNQIRKIENLETLHALQTLELAANKIQTLEGLEDHNFLELLDLEDNLIVDLAEVSRASSLKLLRKLNLRSNPVCEVPDYRHAVVFNVQQLTELDGLQVAAEEKVAAINLFNPSLEYLAARDHMMHVVYSFLQPHRLLDITLPMLETPYPILVLVGPQGVGKKNLAQKLVEELPDYFGYAPSHTTRRPYADEESGKDYHFVSLEEFESYIKMGAFLQTCSYDSELYGLSLEAIEVVARESLACVVHLELEGVLTLKNTYLEPRYVLLLPETRDAHERRLIEKGAYSESQVKAILDRTEVYAEYNRHHPGFFDTTICADDISVMYCQLRKLVLEYLGIASGTTPAKEPSDLETSGTELSIDYGQTVGSNCNGLLRQQPVRGGSAPVTATADSALRQCWSRPSLVDVNVGNIAASKNTPNDIVSMSRSSPAPRGTVEEESLKRRQSAVRGTVAGASPTLFEQLLQQASKDAVGTLPPFDTGAVCHQPSEKRWYSAPVRSEAGYFGAPATTGGLHDSDSRDTQPSATQVSGNAVFVPSTEDHAVTGEYRRLDESTPIQSRPSSSTSANRVRAPQSSMSRSSRSSELAGSTSRPGSSRHAVLPPISQFHASDAVVVTRS